MRALKLKACASTTMAFQSQVADILPPPGLEKVVCRSALTLELSKCLPDDKPGHMAVLARASHLVHSMIRDDFILAHANLELVRQNAELRAEIARMGETMIPVQADAMMMKKSRRVVERVSKNRVRDKLLSLKPSEVQVAVPVESPSPTASTVCSSGCTSEEDESPTSDSRNFNTDVHERSEDEVSQESPEIQSHGTTLIMRNIPFEYTRGTVLELIDRQGFNGLYDLLCMPVDFQTELNHGYVFINFVTLEDASGFKKHFESFSNWSLPSDNVCEVAWFDSAHNIDSHIQRYRDSPLMHESVEDRFKPVLFKNGLRVPFPEPTKKIRPPRRKKNTEQRAN